jgi:hypothetical protein
MKQNITSDIPGIAAIKQEMGVSQNIWHTIKRHFLIHMFRGVFFWDNLQCLGGGFPYIGGCPEDPNFQIHLCHPLVYRGTHIKPLIRLGKYVKWARLQACLSCIHEWGTIHIGNFTSQTWSRGLIRVKRGLLSCHLKLLKLFTFGFELIHLVIKI